MNLSVGECVCVSVGECVNLSVWVSACVGDLSVWVSVRETECV